jgi:ketosteroid isomerase-like protein
MADRDLELLRGAWEAFAAGDLEAATQALDPQVRWYAADEPDASGTCSSRGEALDFLQRAAADGVSAELLELREVGGRIVSIIQTHVPAEWGDQPPPHGEVATVRDGKIVEMVVYPTVDAALQAARA